MIVTVAVCHRVYHKVTGRQPRASKRECLQVSLGGQHFMNKAAKSNGIQHNNSKSGDGYDRPVGHGQPSLASER